LVNLSILKQSVGRTPKDRVAWTLLKRLLCPHPDSIPQGKSSMMRHRKKTDPIELLVEAILDFALVAGFLSAIGFLVSVTGRLVF
jgi:hypothetical protein